ncbi:MAG: hypothetical protein WCW13_03680 [archaeon]
MDYKVRNYFCPKCYGARYETVHLQPEGTDWKCTQEPAHIFTIDGSGFPRTKK